MAKHSSQIVFADEDLRWSLSLQKRLKEEGLDVRTVGTARDLLRRAGVTPPDIVVLGESLDELGGRLLAGLLRASAPGCRIIRVLSGRGPDSRATDDADDILRTVTRRTAAEEIVRVAREVLRPIPEGTLRCQAPLVLCVDDEPQFLQSLSRLLRHHGYRVVTYTEPELALEEFPVVRPDLVILDVCMPGLDGFHVLRELRRYSPEPLQVVLLSALDGDGDVAEGRRLGASSYLTKPCIPEMLLDVVDGLLRTRGKRRQDETGGRSSRELPGASPLDPDKGGAHP
jgi:DNA-binding response OmpR family regulator